jgi:hypothetical protein
MCDIESMRKTRSAGFSAAGACGFGMVRFDHRGSAFANASDVSDQLVASCHHFSEPSVVSMPHTVRQIGIFLRHDSGICIAEKMLVEISYYQLTHSE